ncbi:hypothetical protein HNR25_003245 [Streptomonospora salina]|uniref:Uncharacterized protein n=1 Tax=Streptomonospora salina TaxID=104205 RepID=A0A841EAL7_9ACTN|nr:hypothetical protein [Streptomonospora salina]
MIFGKIPVPAVRKRDRGEAMAPLSPPVPEPPRMAAAPNRRHGNRRPGVALSDERFPG